MEVLETNRRRLKREFAESGCRSVRLCIEVTVEVEGRGKKRKGNRTARMERKDVTADGRRSSSTGQAM
jgi:hypothetical protein